MKKIVILLNLFVFSIISGFSETLQSYLDKIANNQNQIKTEVAVGTFTIIVYNEKNEVIKNMVSDLTLYLKFPNMIKIIIKSRQDNNGITIVQIGDIITQKMSNSNQVTKQKATEQSDLFKKYLGYGIDKLLHGFMVNNGGPKDNNIIEYELVPRDAMIGIDKYILDIDTANNTDVYSTYYYKGEQAVEIFKNYIQINGIQVLKKLKLVTRKQGVKLETIFDYKSIDLNSKILDKEFELQ